MKKPLSVLSIAAIAIFLGSCGSSEQAASPPPQSPTAQTPQPNPSPDTAATPNAQTQTPSPTKTATAPSTSSVAGLIPSTNANQRRQKIAQGRKDPFGFVPVQPQLKTLPTPQASPGTIPQPSPQRTVTNQPNPNVPQQPGTVTPPPSLPPQPELAQGVAISGIIDVGGAPQIIVKAPGERVSRYVQVGDYLSNGQVLVKRIERYQSPSPVVVLEELGQEVYKEVGEGIAQEPSKPTQQETTAMMPELQEGDY
ncbi:MAG: hypothetical protein MUD14_11185 [Hydrococcus sp. Prado102]|jgi:hypothetical protein|nr:hypothetical protein [Hydrococcus sp. Prado102]